MERINLNGLWQGICVQKPEISFIGTVPGSVLGDLISSGLCCDDIFYRDNAESVQEYEKYDWVYTKKFTAEHVQNRCKVVFERLDTYCDIYLNGEHLGSAENGHIPHEFDVSGRLISGENALSVYFYSPVKKVEGRKKREGAFTTERLYTRRVQCTYGWDWTMRFVTCGICRDAYIVPYAEKTAVRNAYIYTKNLDEDSAQLGIELYFEKQCGGVLTFQIFDDRGIVIKRFQRFCDEKFVVLGAEIEEPQLWYPHGYGGQPLYTFAVWDENGELYSEKFGIRTVKIMQLTDCEDGAYYNKCIALKKSEFAKYYDKNEEFSGFILKVNGIRIMCKGANWVPSEPFQNGSCDKKVTETLELAKLAGFNMLRIWGGGTFESEHFYDECSRLGIMVTQDFLMACGKYPEDEQWFLDELAKEAEYASIYLRNQPCLMWWSGDNENAVEGCETDENYPGRRAAYHAIAPVLYKNDPYREFLPSSPYGGTKYASNTVGTTHNTQYLSYTFAYFEKEDLSDYKEYFQQYRARFIAEEPAMGAVGIHTLRKMMAEDEIFGDDLSMWTYHTKTNPELSKELFQYIWMFAEKVLGRFENAKDRFFKLKYLQYEWVRITLEQARREKWFCSGIIYWMLNDCWPAAAGWSFLDYYNVPKAAFYSFKRCAALVMASINYENGVYRVYVSNDSLKDVNVKLTLRSVDVKNNEVTELYEAHSTAIANSTQVLAEHRKSYGKSIVVIADIYHDDKHDRAFYRKGALNLVKKEIEYEIGESKIIVRASEYIHAVEIDACVLLEDNCFSLMPGEERCISYSKLNGKEVGDIIVTAYGL